MATPTGSLRIRKRPPVELTDLLNELFKPSSTSHSVAYKLIQLAGSRKLTKDLLIHWNEQVGLGSRSLAYSILRVLKRIGMLRRISGGEYVLSKEFSMYLRSRAEFWDRYVDSWKMGE